MRRLVPDPGPTSIDEQLGAYRPWDDPPADRPHLALNFATTLDGRAAIDGRSGAIGSDTDTAMLVGLRLRFDAVMIGAGTMRAERYGRIVSDPAKRAGREALGLPGDPLMVIVGGLDLPWDAPLFTDGGGEVLLFTGAEDDPPETATPVDVVREPGGRVDIAKALRHLRDRARRARRPLRGRPRASTPSCRRGGSPTSSSYDRAETGRRRALDPRRRPPRGRRARARPGCSQEESELFARYRR